jgi:hypothetical protein
VGASGRPFRLVNRAPSPSSRPREWNPAANLIRALFVQLNATVLPSLATYTQPHGSSFRESTVSLGLKHRFDARWIGTAKVGYFDSSNGTTGGNTRFRGPLAWLAVEHEL